MFPLSRQIRLWRAFRGLSQKELALRAGMPRPNVIDLEMGRRDCTVGSLVKLARALGVSPGQLLDRCPRQPATRLRRFERDALARSLVTGVVPAKFKTLAREFGPLFRPALEAAGLRPPAPGGREGFVRRRKHHLESLYSREFVNDVIERVRRLLPAFPPIQEGR